MRRYVADPFGARGTVEAVVYMLLVTLLTASAVAYLLARLGHLQRVRGHRRVPRAVMDAAFDESNPTLTAIIPSYKEDRRVIRQTLLSAALQEFPNLRVVLLIDDPANPTSEIAKRQLAEARALPGEIAELLEPPRRRFEAALDAFESSSDGGTPIARRHLAPRRDLRRRRDLPARAGPTARRSPTTSTPSSSTRSSSPSRSTSRPSPLALREAMVADAEISAARVRRLYRRLVWIFRADISSFERKRFASLSHEPNKAMNLNSYLGLMGGRYRIRETPAGAIHLPVRGGSFDLEVPDPDYVLTLDADSMLLPEYCLRLVAFMEQPENADVAVVADPVLGVPRRTDAHRAARRRDDRPAAHRPPGPDALRRHLLGRRQRGPAQAARSTRS